MALITIAQLAKALPEGPKYLHYREHCWRCEAPFPWLDKQCKGCGRTRKHMLGKSDTKMARGGFTVDEAHVIAHRIGIDFAREKFTAAQLARGMNVELEHADVTKRDAAKTAHIAIAHLREKADYYSLLEEVEKSLPRFFIKADGGQPPKGYTTVPHSKHGGFRKRTADGYVYWYPSAHTSAQPEHEHWDEKAFAEGSYDRDPSHWVFMRGPLGPIPWTAGGLDPHSKHPVKIAGDDAHLYQIVMAEESVGWARLRDVHSGEEKPTAHDRVMPVEHHVGKGPAPREKGAAVPPWDPGAPHEGKATGWVAGSAERMQPYEQSTAKAGTILHNVEHAAYPTKLMRRIKADADGSPHTTEVRAMAMPDSDKVKLIGEFDRMIKKVAVRASKRFALRRTKEVDSDMRSAAVEGMLHGIDTYHGGHSFLQHAEFMADQHARLHAAREFAGGLAMTSDHARLLQGFIAAQAEARRVFGHTPDNREIAAMWRIKKRDLHRGIETGRNEEIPMHPYTIKAGEIVGGNDKPGKLALVDSYLEFLSGQHTAGGSDALDEHVALLPGIGVGVGMSEHDKVIAAEAMHAAFAELTNHEVQFAQNTYRSDAGAILTRMLGLDMEPQSVAQIAKDIPIYRIDRAGVAHVASHRSAYDVIPKMLESGLSQLRGRLMLGDEAGGVIERAYRRVVKPVVAAPGPTWFATMRARAQAVTRDQVRVWRAGEREKLRKLATRVASAGGKHAAERSARLDKLRGDLTKIGLRRARMLVAEQMLLSQPATRQWFASATGVHLDVPAGRGKEYTPITMTLTDPATGSQRVVKLRSVHDVKKSEGVDAAPDAGALHFAAMFPRLTHILYGSHDPEAWVPSPERLRLLEQIGCLEPEGE